MLLWLLLLSIIIIFITFLPSSNKSNNNTVTTTTFRSSDDIPQGWTTQDKINSCINSWKSGSISPPYGCDFNCKSGDPSCYCVKSCNNDNFHFSYDCSAGIDSQPPPCPF